MKRFFTTCVLAAGMACAVSAGAGSGEAALPFLNDAAGARALGMSGATGAITDGAFTLYTNPAGLGWLRVGSAMFAHHMGVAEVATEILGVTYPVREVGTLGVGVWYRGQPDIDNGIPGEDPIAVRDMAVSLGGGRRLADAVSAGAALKVINSILGEATANAFAADLGVQAEVGPQWRFGLGLHQLGTGVTYVEHTASLPARLNASAAWRAPLEGPHAALGALDVHYGLVESDWGVEVGAEYAYANTGFLRAGYFTGPESLKSFTAGAGLALEAAGLVYYLDYAFAPRLWDGFGQSEAEHTLTIGVSF